MTLNELETLPSETILSNVEVDGKIHITTVIDTAKNVRCDICETKYLRRVVKVETTSKVNILTQCLKCAMEEL